MLNNHKSRARILLLSNERSSGRVLKTALDNIGYMDVSVTVSPREAITRFVHQRFDLLIMNLDLPEIGGFELIRRIRAGETIVPRDLTILMLAKEDDFEDDQCLADLGVNGIAMIPFTLKELADHIAYALSHHYLAQEAIEVMDAPEVLPPSAQTQPNGPLRAFSLPFEALGEGMYLLEPIKVHGRVLIPAGTCLREIHLTVIEQMAYVLEGGEVLLSFSVPSNNEDYSKHAV